MKQLFLTPSFNIKTLRQAPKSTRSTLEDWYKKLQQEQLSSLRPILGDFIPQALFDNDAKSHPNSRRRLFTPENTFWGFLQQILKGVSCQSIVQELKAVAHLKQSKPISASTSAYCQARQRLPSSLLTEVFEHTAQRGHTVHPLVNRRVVCADGTGLLASDTQDNQQHWPQVSTQKEGCGFPQIRLCGVFNLYTGTALSYAIGGKRSHELPLLRDQESCFQAGDIFIGDKGFTCFYDQARLHLEGVDSIVSLSRQKPVKASKAIKVIGHNDLLINQSKSRSSTTRKRYPSDVWDTLPDTLPMRQIKVDIGVPGYRSEYVYLLTTLIDHERYPSALIAQLYRERWHVELRFRDIKTTMGMEFIHAKSPEMVLKCIQMFMIGYNLIRALMVDANTEKAPTRLSFKCSIETVLSFANHQSLSQSTPRKIRCDILSQIAENRLPERERLNEPRVVKQRPKPFKRMMKSRESLREELYQNAA